MSTPNEPKSPVDENQNIDPNAVPKPEEKPAPTSDDEWMSRIKKDMLAYKERMKALEKENEALKLKTHKEKEDWKSIAEETSFRASDFEGVTTKKALYEVLGEKFPGMSRAEVNLTVYRNETLLDLITELGLDGLL